MTRRSSTLAGGLVAAGLLAALMALPTNANAQRTHPVYRGTRVIIGAPIIASPWWYDPFPYPYYYGYGPYYYPPAPYVYEQPMVYVEKTPPPEAAPAPTQYWYYCQSSKTYYPYVQTCATSWQRVIPNAPQ